MIDEQTQIEIKKFAGILYAAMIKPAIKVNDNLVDFPCEFDMHSLISIRYGRRILKLMDGSYQHFMSCNEVQFFDKLPISLRYIEGDFDVSNLGLTSTTGFPIQLKQSAAFKCSYNRLTSLIGLPKMVGHLNCSDNLLTNLNGCPNIFNIETSEKFIIARNNCLTSLVGAPFMAKIDITGNKCKIPNMKREINQFCFDVIDENSMTDKNQLPVQASSSVSSMMRIVRIKDSDSW